MFVPERLWRLTIKPAIIQDLGANIFHRTTQMMQHLKKLHDLSKTEEFSDLLQSTDAGIAFPSVGCLMLSLVKPSFSTKLERFQCSGACCLDDRPVLARTDTMPAQQGLQMKIVLLLASLLLSILLFHVACAMVMSIEMLAAGRDIVTSTRVSAKQNICCAKGKLELRSPPPQP